MHPSGSVISIYFVHMKMIDKIIREKGFAALSELEQLCYLFKNGTKGVILKVRKGLVKSFMEKYKKMEKEQEWWTLADAIERGEQAKNALLKETYQQGMEQGKRQGIEQGIEQGKEQEKKNILSVLMKTKFHIDANEWIHTLSYDELEQAVLLLLDCDNFKDLKSKMKESPKE